MPSLPKHHISLTKSSEFINACNNLFFTYPITFVYYGILGVDGKNTCMTNRPDWHEFYWGESNFTANIMTRVKEGVNYWQTKHPLSKQNLVAKKYFNIDNKLEIVTKTAYGYEMLGFGSVADDHNVLNFYFNNIEKLKCFPLYFKDKCKSLWKQMMQIENRIPLCQPLRKVSTINGCQFNVIQQLKHIEQLSAQEVRVLLYTILNF